MGRFVLGIVLFVVHGEAGAASPSLPSDYAVLLSTQGEDVVAGPIWSGVKTTVSSIFGEVGIRVVWRDASANSEAFDRQFPIMVQLAGRLPPTLQERGPTCADVRALACSWPFDESPSGRIVVMYERLWPLSLRPRLFQPLLSYVIAHEIAHILERKGDHSDCGIMKQHWDAADFDAMQDGRLTFTARDTALIQEGLISDRRGADRQLGKRRQ